MSVCGCFQALALVASWYVCRYLGRNGGVSSGIATCKGDERWRAAILLNSV